MKIGFLSSSELSIPILESIIQAQSRKLSIYEVFLEQFVFLADYLSDFHQSLGLLGRGRVHDSYSIQTGKQSNTNNKDAQGLWNRQNFRVDNKDFQFDFYPDFWLNSELFGEIIKDGNSTPNTNYSDIQTLETLDKRQKNLWNWLKKYGFAEDKIQNLFDSLSSPITLDLVISQPDRANRGKIIQNPIARFCSDLGIDLFQPQKINIALQEYLETKNSDQKEEVENMNRYSQKYLDLDIAIVAAFGQILSKTVLESPKYGLLNWHPSILPIYRGASPMQTSLKNGDNLTALTWLNLGQKMDAGDVWLQIPKTIGVDEDITSLSEHMSDLGAKTWALSIFTKLIFSHT